MGQLDEAQMHQTDGGRTNNHSVKQGDLTTTYCIIKSHSGAQFILSDGVHPH